MMENNYQTIFSEVLSDTKLHVRFLNTLSLMELCGAKKLARLANTNQCSTFILEHVAEEFRHAHFLRKLAVKIAGNEINYSDDLLWRPQEAKNYINKLDRSVCLLLKQHGLADGNLIKERAFLLTTFAIESRALPFYRAYQASLDFFGLAISVKSIISEEESHLNNIKNQLSMNKDLLKLSMPTLEIEAKLFNRWL